MSFNVLFRGLVCHLTEEKVAVFVEAQKHELRLVVRDSDIVGKPTFESDLVHAVEPEETDPPPRKSFRIAGGTLRIEGVTDKKLSRKDDFDLRVPSLRKGAEGMKMTVRKEVRQQRKASGIAGYLQIPGGVLSVRNYFPDQAVFTGTTPECIARVVQLAMETTGKKSVTIRNGSKRVTLKPDAEVAIVNVDETATEGMPNQHFHHYYHAIYSNGAMGQTPQPVAGPGDHHCPKAPQSGPIFPGSDCSNSQEP